MFRFINTRSFSPNPLLFLSSFLSIYFSPPLVHFFTPSLHPTFFPCLYLPSFLPFVSSSTRFIFSIFPSLPPTLPPSLLSSRFQTYFPSPHHFVPPIHLAHLNFFPPLYHTCSSCSHYHSCSTFSFFSFPVLTSYSFLTFRFFVFYNFFSSRLSPLSHLLILFPISFV